MKYMNERNEIVKIAKLMFDRKMTNTTGGNLSIRVAEDLYLMTPSMMSMEKMCEIDAEDIVLVNRKGEKIEGNGRLTREFNMHLALYDERIECKAIVHAHPRECMVFASLGTLLPNMTESTMKLGTIDTLPFAKAGSIELANVVRNYLNNTNNKFPVVMMLNKHGVLAGDISLARAYDLIERVEHDAYIYLNADKAIKSKKAFVENESLISFLGGDILINESQIKELKKELEQHIMI